MQLFLKDYPFINKSKGIIAPNLPPSNWYDFAKSKKKENTTGIVRLVHVGALSLDTMYVKEIVEWVISQKGLFTLDFYSSNCPENSRKFIENLQNNNIKLFPNPSNGSVKITGIDDKVNGIWRIENEMGQVMDKGILKSQVWEFDISHFAPGNYFLVLGNHQPKVIHFIKSAP